MNRALAASVLAGLMARTGFRFSRSFRRGDTLGHRLVYAMVNTVRANTLADERVLMQQVHA